MSQITLLDGSIGQELVHRSDAPPHYLWSTQVMLDQPDLVGDVHRDYFAAGATVATTNTYAVHRNRLQREGIEDQLEPLITAALAQAQAARKAHGSGRLAGALGPLLASYQPHLKPDVALASERYGELVSLIGPHVDVILLETVSSVLEGEGALRGCAQSPVPVWLAVSVSDEDGTKLRSGEPLSAIAPLVEQFAPAAVLINCSTPEAVSEGMPVLAGLGRPFGAYANGFTRISDAFLTETPIVDALTARKDLSPEDYAQFGLNWVAQGATIVGGCCEIGPAHIAELARALRAAGHDIV